jgi:hypothetical protein
MNPFSFHDVNRDVKANVFIMLQLIILTFGFGILDLATLVTFLGHMGDFDF